MKEGTIPNTIRPLSAAPVVRSLRPVPPRKNITVEICSNCHPFYTGKQRFVDTAGRIDRFRKKYAKFQENA